MFSMSHRIGTYPDHLLGREKGEEDKKEKQLQSKSYLVDLRREIILPRRVLGKRNWRQRLVPRDVDAVVGS